MIRKSEVNRLVSITLMALLSCAVIVCVQSRAMAAPPAAKSVSSGAQGGAKDKNEKKKTSEETRKDIDGTLRALIDAFEKVKAVSAAIKTKMPRNVGDKASSLGEGVYNFQVDGDKMRLRYYIQSTIDFWIGGDHMFTAEHIEYVTDGNLLEEVTIQPELRQVRRKRFDPADILYLGGRRVINELRQNYEIKSMTTETRDGRDAVVFRCKPSDGDTPVTFVFDTQTGIRVEWSERDAKDKAFFSIKLERLNTSPKFEEEDLKKSPIRFYTLVDETGPEPKSIPWEELLKILPPEETFIAPDPSTLAGPSAPDSPK